MKIYSLNPNSPYPLPPELSGPARFCHDCHNRARWVVTFGGKRPQLRLCNRCAKYIAGFLNDKLGELNPIPDAAP